jgi:hypothetical protein
MTELMGRIQFEGRKVSKINLTRQGDNAQDRSGGCMRKGIWFVRDSEVGRLN